MRLKLFAAVAMLAIGVGAIGLSVVGPSLAASSSSKYITATAAVQTVSAQSVATGNIAASTTYGLRFGAQADVLSSGGSSASTGTGSSSAATGSTGSGSGSASVTWPVKTVTATVGQQVKKGDVLATADASSAQLQLTSAQASLAAAQAKLATDQGGPDANTKASAIDQVNQAQNQLNQAVANQKTTNAQNALKLSQAQQAVTDAQTKLNTDTAANAASAVITQDQNALASAQSQLSSTQLQVQASNQQAAQQVTNAQLGLTSAQHGYASKTAPAPNATVLADQAQVASAQTAVDNAQAAVNAASIVAPADGLVTTVNIRPGVNAPSGYAVQLQVGPLVATASFTESDVTKLKVGQQASVTISAAGQAVDGTVTQIQPVASTSGGASSVVTYAVTVQLSQAPANVLAGMTATVTVTTASVDSALAVPSTALRGSALTGYTVQIMNGDGTVSDEPVEVGLVTTSMAQITGGLTAGQKVVTGTTTTRTSTSANNGGFSIPGVNGGGNRQFQGVGR